MKRHVIVTMLSLVLSICLFSQPGSGGGFNLYRNLVYYDQGSSSLHLDVYSPGGQLMAGGIGMEGKNQNIKTSANDQVHSVPVLIWFPGADKNIFPTPVAGLIGNGYAIISAQCMADSDKLKNISQVISYIKINSSKFFFDEKNIGIILPVENGYSGIIWMEGMEKLKSISDATEKINIEAAGDDDFEELLSSENTSILVSFFDIHLRKGIHYESDPFSLKCPADSWADPIINPIPGTTYNLFSTPVRGKDTWASYLIYLPEDYEFSAKRYPVIYWLHGGNGNSREGNWMCKKMKEAMKMGKMPQSIVVFVQGLPIGWYNNSKDGTMPVEDVIIKDLIPHIDGSYRTINDRKARGIEGMSMGGYGSLHLGFKYPELFGVVSSIAPSITTFEMERKEVIVPTFANDAAYFNENSPISLVQKNAEYLRKNTILRILVGDKDFLLDMVQKFHQKLTDLQISHQYTIAKDADHDYREVIQNLNIDPFKFWKEAFQE